jgi:hypothetical protein
VRVVDGDTGEDITRRVLIQILLEQRSAKMLELLPVELLRALVAMPGDPLTRWLGDYLAAGARWLEWQMAGSAAQSMQGAFAGLWPGGAGAPQPPPPAEPPPRGQPQGRAPAAPGGDLRAELDELWRRLGQLRRS